MADISLTSSTGGTPTWANEDGHGPLVQVNVITIPAACTDAVISILPEPGAEVILKPDMNGTGTDTWTARATREDANEPTESLTLTDSVATSVGDPGRLTVTYATGNTLSYIVVKERIATRIAR